MLQYKIKKFKKLPESSVTNINNILMQYFLKKSNLMQKSHGQQNITILNKDGTCEH